MSHVLQNALSGCFTTFSSPRCFPPRRAWSALHERVETRARAHSAHTARKRHLRQLFEGLRQAKDGQLLRLHTRSAHGDGARIVGRARRIQSSLLEEAVKDWDGAGRMGLSRMGCGGE